MGERETSQDPSAVLGVEDPSDPIERIRRDHDRQLEICSRLENILSASEAEPISEWAASVLDFLKEDLPLHIDDEEVDLFPTLLAELGPKEDLAAILDQLAAEHELDRGLIEPIIEGLESIIEGKPLARAARFQMYVRTFTEAQRRHLNWEDRIVLPLAEKVLSKEARIGMGRKMKARRHESLTPDPS